MTDLIVINIHSFVDVITNSSSELFVMRDDKTLGEIESIITSMIECPHCGKSIGKSFEEMFSPIRLATKEDVDRFKEWDWYNIKIKEGDVILESCTDNSIPYELIERIDGKFLGTRYHLG